MKLSSEQPTSTSTSTSSFQTNSSIHQFTINDTCQDQNQTTIKTLTQTCTQIIAEFILSITNKTSEEQSTHNESTNDTYLQIQFDLIFNFIFDSYQNQPKISSEQFKPIIQSILQSIKTTNHHHHIRKPQSGSQQSCRHQLPFALYASVLKAYQDVTIFNTNPTKNSTQTTSTLTQREPYAKLVLKDETKFKILFNSVPPSNLEPKLNLNYLTILNLSWYSSFSDQDLRIIHQSIKHSITILRLDYTSITDLGIFNLTHDFNLQNKFKPLSSNLKEFDLDYLDSDRQLNWCKLSFLSLKGLKSVTDRALVYLSKFPNLSLIDLNQTSCTQASRQIINQSIIKSYQKLVPLQSSSSQSSTTLKQFHHPKSKSEIELFSGRLTPTEKFLQFIKFLEIDLINYEFVQIDWIDNNDQPNEFQSNYKASKLHKMKAFFHKSIQIEPLETPIDPSLCLILDLPFKSVQLNPIKITTTPTHLDHQLKVKRNFKTSNTLALDGDLSLLGSYQNKRLKK